MEHKNLQEITAFSVLDYLAKDGLKAARENPDVDPETVLLMEARYGEAREMLWSMVGNTESDCIPPIPDGNVTLRLVKG